MKKFSEYSQNFNDNAKNNDSGGGNNPFNGNGTAFEMLKNISAKYEGASQSELLSAIFAEASRARNAGTLSDSEIENFVASVSPMLSKSQRNQLEKVVERIKNTK